MTDIVTGASGYLGRRLTHRFDEMDRDYVGLSSRDADLTFQESLLPYNTVKYDRIFHLASWTQAGDFCLYHRGEQWLINQQINTTVLSWWQKHQPQAKLVSIGTSCSYPVGSDHREELYLDGTPIEDLFTYAMTKRMLLIGQQSLNKQFGLRYLTVVPSTLYGPGYEQTNKQAHFIFDLIRKILRHKHFGEDVILWGDGSQRREVVFIDDFVGTMLELDAKVENEVVNIGAGEDHSIREFAELICDIAGVNESDIQYDPAQYVGAKVKSLNNAKLDMLLPERPTIALREGLSRTITWMEERIRNQA